jgi:hypothetical protein
MSCERTSTPVVSSGFVLGHGDAHDDLRDGEAKDEGHEGQEGSRQEPVNRLSQTRSIFFECSHEACLGSSSVDCEPGRGGLRERAGARGCRGRSDPRGVITAEYRHHRVFARALQGAMSTLRNRLLPWIWKSLIRRCGPASAVQLGRDHPSLRRRGYMHGRRPSRWTSPSPTPATTPSASMRVRQEGARTSSPWSWRSLRDAM